MQALHAFFREAKPSSFGGAKGVYMSIIYEKKSFEDFKKGTFGNGGKNLYVSANGVLQRIYNYDVTGNGYPDIPMGNSHGMGERPDVRILGETADGSFSFRSFPSEGSFDAVSYDLCGDGFDDLVIACQNNGTHADGVAVIYHGNKNGISIDYREELPVPDAIGVAAGHFDGKKPALAFICGGFLRVFYQDERGFDMIVFQDIDISASSAASADLDGDGYDDLYLKCTDGSVCVLWGGPDGLKKDCMTKFTKSDPEPGIGRGTTATRRPHSFGWRCAVVKDLVYVGGKHADFYRFTKERKAVKEFTINTANSVFALCRAFTSGDSNDLVLLTADGLDKESPCVLYKNWDKRKKITFSIRGAITGSFVALKSGNVLAVACRGDSILHTKPSYIVSFENGKAETVLSFDAHEPARLVPGRFNGKDTEIAVIDHESGRVNGDEMARIYFGGPEGYTPERNIELQGSAAVDMHFVDLNDDGRTDVVLTNCSENAPATDPGSFIYYQDENGLSNERRTILPTVRAHGMAIGDFQKRGYLDIAAGGLCNREIRIFRGGPDGYSMENSYAVVMGPDDGNYRPTIGNVFSEDMVWPEGEKELAWTHGEIRWLGTADLTGNGWLDLFVSCIQMPYILIYLGGPDGFRSDRFIKLNAPGAINCTMADLNKNGYLDLVLSHHFIKAKKSHYESYVSIYWGGPDGYRENRKTLLPTHCANAVTVGDFNGNGWLDIYATCYNNGRERDLLSWVFPNDNGHFNYRDRYPIYNHSGSGCIAGDFNGDGYTDLIIANHKDTGNHTCNSYILWGGPDGIKEERRTELPSCGPHGLATVHPGNIMDRGPAEYYDSEPLPVPAGTEKITVSYEGQLLGKGYVRLYVKAAASEAELSSAEWIETEPGKITDLHKFLSGTSGFAAYRLALCAPCSAGNVRINYVKAEFI